MIHLVTFQKNIVFSVKKQFCFRAREEIVHALIEIGEKMRKKQLEHILVLLDLRRAFDSLDLDELLQDRKVWFMWNFPKTVHFLLEH